MNLASEKLVSKFAFKWVNLRRYEAGDILLQQMEIPHAEVWVLYKLNPVDP